MNIAGWKLVPVEPTTEMLRAGCGAGLDVNVLLDDSAFACDRAVYTAMLAAAPTPPAPEVKPVTRHNTPFTNPNWPRGLSQEIEPVAIIDESDEGRFADLTTQGTFLKRGTKLYTHPANDGLRKAAEEVAQDLEGLTGWPRLQQLGEKLRAELEKK